MEKEVKPAFIVGVGLLIFATIVLFYPWGDYEGIQTKEKFILIHDINIFLSTINIQFNSNSLPQTIDLNYDLIHNNATQNGTVIFVVPYEGKLFDKSKTWQSKEIQNSEASIIFKRYTCTLKSPCYRDTGNFSFAIDGIIDSRNTYTRFIQIPFSTIPITNEVSNFIRTLTENETSSIHYGWDGTSFPPTVYLKLSKDFDQWDTKPSSYVGSSLNLNGGNDIILGWDMLKNNNPVFIVNYSDKFDREAAEAKQQLIAFSFSAGITLFAVAVTIELARKDQHYLKRFITKTRHLQDANFSFVLKEFKAAKKSYDKVLGIDNSDILALLNAGASLQYLGRWFDAKSYYVQILTFDPNNILAWNNLGVSQFNLNEYDKALYSYKESLKIDPNDDNTVNNLGVLYLYGFRDFPKALSCFNKIIKNQRLFGPDLADIIVNKATTLVLQKKYSDALLECDRALSIDSNNVKALTEKGNVLFNLGRYDEAKPYFLRVLKINPLNNTTIFNLGSVLLEKREYKEALLHFKEYLVTYPEDSDTLELIVECCTKLEIFDEKSLWLNKYFYAKKKSDCSKKNKLARGEITMHDYYELLNEKKKF